MQTSDAFWEMIRNGEDFGHQNQQGETALMIYAGQHDDCKVGELLKSGKSYPEKRDNKGETALMKACWNFTFFYHTIYKLSHFAPEYIKIQNNKGQTALMISSGLGQYEIVKILLETGQAHPEVKDNNGVTALMLACECYYLSGYEDYKEYRDKQHYQSKPYFVAKYLLESGQSHPEYQDNNGWTALMFACRLKSHKVVELLLDSGMSHPEFKNNDGKTALIIACSVKTDYVYDYILHERILRELLSHPNCCPEHQDKYGWTALMYVCNNESIFDSYEKHDTYNVNMLLEYDTHPELKNNDGRTALMLVCEGGGSINMVKALLNSNQAHPEYQDNKGNTALMLVCSLKYFKSIDIVKALIDYNQEHIELRNNDGHSALDLARMNNLHNIVNILSGDTDISDDTDISESLRWMPNNMVKNNHLKEYVTDDLQCPICLDNIKGKDYKKLYVAECGHVYCSKKCIYGLDKCVVHPLT